ncbi:MAG: hypothetical protein UV93_C0001G0132 [Candidatus Azambacteria bacterium GW2011_GWC2_43_27]|nr:MAG: hypothetical protein UU33_C0001G0533 [Candidatus Azambacteria bacterium GW2011_GWF1_41_10]KKS49566.1 MAG: hypothetical protein UV14_C0001G0312 [Candidatus Azambacteria bacterium GW2011_GWF2_42_22]KKT03677.1 MAG: hypothetical protein UV81_C0001G0273 [Candidatus Azambacteria bacterium GW2011_GWD1_43_18]KKT12831.1 MAG: hypothetical protein UV93_C0001G0132 [Candidatus Azambacteria bacterium GW2011_GWC2_43_27]
MIAVAVFGLFIATPSAGAVTIAELIAQIQALRKQLVELQSQQGTTTAWCHDFNTNLRIGDEGSEVLSLHNALVKEGLLSDYYASKDFDGSTGFNENTSSAVTGFQQKYADEILRSYGLKYGTGFVGKSTRAKLNKLYGCGVATPLPAPMPTPMPVPIISFTANNVSDTLNITENTSVTLSWFAINADSCSSSGGTSGWATTSRSVSGSAEPADSSHVSATYTLTCKNSSGLSSSKSIRVNVKEASTTITPAPTITVLSPNGGESWQVGSTQKISWRTSNISSPNDKITIYIAPNDDLSKNINIAQQIQNTGYYDYIVRDPSEFNYHSPLYKAGNQFRILVCVQSVGSNNLCSYASDWNDAAFTIAAPPVVTPSTSITITSPSAGTVWTQGKTYRVSWTSNGMMTVGMTLSASSGGYSQSISGLVGNSSSGSGSADFLVPANFPAGSAQFYLQDNSSAKSSAQVAVTIIAPAGFYQRDTSLGSIYIGPTLTWKTPKCSCDLDSTKGGSTGGGDCWNTSTPTTDAIGSVCYDTFFDTDYPSAYRAWTYKAVAAPSASLSASQTASILQSAQAILNQMMEFLKNR